MALRKSAAGGVSVRLAIGQLQFIPVYHQKILPSCLLCLQPTLPPHQRHETQHDNEEKGNDQPHIFSLHHGEQCRASTYDSGKPHKRITVDQLTQASDSGITLRYILAIGYENIFHPNQINLKITTHYPLPAEQTEMYPIQFVRIPARRPAGWSSSFVLFRCPRE